MAPRSRITLSIARAILLVVWRSREREGFQYPRLAKSASLNQMLRLSRSQRDKQLGTGGGLSMRDDLPRLRAVLPRKSTNEVCFSPAAVWQGKSEEVISSVPRFQTAEAAYSSACSPFGDSVQSGRSRGRCDSHSHQSESCFVTIALENNGRARLASAAPGMASSKSWSQ